MIERKDEVETSHRRRQQIMNKRAEKIFVISKSSLNQDEVETSHRLYIRQHIMNKRAEKIFYFVISKSSLNQDEVETSHRLYTRLGYDKYDF